MSFSGFYLAYFSAEFGNSIGIFVITDHEIVGADLGGGMYDGSFEIEDGSAVGQVRFRTNKGGQTITGASNDLPISHEVSFKFALPLEAPEYHELETLTGPVNVRFEKIREL